MSSIRKIRPLATELQLFKPGTARTYDLLLTAAMSLSDADLAGLENDLNVYSETRLIGIYMSRMQRVLLREASETATTSAPVAMGNLVAFPSELNRPNNRQTPPQTDLEHSQTQMRLAQ